MSSRRSRRLTSSWDLVSESPPHVSYIYIYIYTSWLHRVAAAFRHLFRDRQESERFAIECMREKLEDTGWVSLGLFEGTLEGQSPNRGPSCRDKPLGIETL